MVSVPYANRQTRLQNLLPEQNLDCMLITNIVNIRYLTGFTGSAGVLLVQNSGVTLYVDGRYTEQAQKEVRTASTRPAVAIGAPRPILHYALQQLPEQVRRLGFEANFLTVLERDQVQALLPEVGLVALDRPVENLRTVKDQSELASMQQAIDITDDVFAAFCEWIEPGMRENEVAARLEYEQRLAGGERNASGVTIVASGPRTSLPHGVASDRIIGNNEPIMVDIGTVVDGYCSDLTRTVFIGSAPDSFKTLYQLVYKAQQQALDGIRAGMTGIEADKLARDVIAEGGYPDNFEHSLAHAIGLEVHERPLLNPRDSSVIHENMVFTIEPGVYLTGQFGVRIEDVARVTANGCEVLSKADRNLLEL